MSKKIILYSYNYIFICFIVGILNISIFSATITLNAGSGNGTNNEWNTGGTTVGDDCAQQGGTAANTGTKNDNLVTPLDGPAASGTITSIEVRVYAKADIDLSGTGDGIRVRIMSVYSEGIDATTDELTTSYAYYSHIFTTDPNTSAAWTWSGIISLEVGCRAIAGGKQDFSQLDVDHIEVIVNYNAEPVLTGLTGEDTLSSSECFQRTDGTGNVEINYRVSDADHSTVTVTVEYWNGTWNAAEDTYISGDKGSVDATSSTTDRQILWNAANELGAVEVTDYNIRVTATDASSDADQISLASNSLTIDTKEPTGYGCGTPSDGASPGPGNVTLESSVASDAGTVSYYFEIDDNATFLSPSASGWQEADNNWVSSGMVAGQTYYWHVKVRDSYGNETAYSSSFSFTVSNVKPTVSVNSVTEADNGTGLVTVNYNLEDPQNPENCKLLLEFSVDNKSTWNQAYISSASVGSIDNTGVGAGSSTGQITGISTNVSNQTFVWDSKNSGNEGGSQNNSEYSDVYFRITPEDVSSNTGATITSISFVLDNKVPSGYDCTTPANLSTNISLSPTLASTAATDISTFQYYFELDTDNSFSSPLQNSGWQSQETWQPSTQLTASTTYYWHVKTKDAYGNEDSFQSTCQFTTASALWIYPSSGTIGACNSPCLGDGVVYVGTGGTDDKLYCIDITDGSLKWSYQASADVKNAVCYYYSSPGKYAVYFTTSDAGIYALWDDGDQCSVKFTNVGLGNKSISDLMIDIEGTYLYLGYWKTGHKRSASDGSLVWETGTVNPSATSAAVVDNANVYFTSGSVTYKYTIDNVAQGSASFGTSDPLGAWNGVLYIPAADNFVYAVYLSNMTTKWTSSNLGASTNTAALYTSDYVYVGAGSNLKTVNSYTGVESGSYSAGNTINSMPIVTTDNEYIFFGCDDSKAYGITTANQNISGWPKTAGGAIQNTPAVDEVNGVVVFCTNEGKVYGYVLP